MMSLMILFGFCLYSNTEFGIDEPLGHQEAALPLKLVSSYPGWLPPTSDISALLVNSQVKGQGM